MVSSRCGGLFVGAMSIRVTEAYPSSADTLLTTDRSSVPAGQTVTLSGADCPTGQPTASLDGQRLSLAADRTAKGRGFTATATIPGDTAPGRHQLWAGCDAGAAVPPSLDVLDPKRSRRGRHPGLGPSRVARRNLRHHGRVARWRPVSPSPAPELTPTETPRTTGSRRRSRRRLPRTRGPGGRPWPSATSAAGCWPAGCSATSAPCCSV